MFKISVEIMVKGSSRVREKDAGVGEILPAGSVSLGHLTLRYPWGSRWSS